jgi:sugar (pentulose or hexulose) kinase
MDKQEVIAVFDIGKTNKKLFLFDKQYQIVYEKSVVLPEIKDEDDFPCEDLQELHSFIRDSFAQVLAKEEFDVKAVNFSAYGASLVYVGQDGKPVAPLYNYLKPYPESLLRQFYETYGGEERFSNQTASPILGSLNSGMQLYRLKHAKPQLFREIKYAFHLPQYVSHLICNSHCSDITSVGCHTNLWDFQKGSYHDWVFKEGVLDKLLPIVPSDTTLPVSIHEHRFKAGIGLHDSSAALIPYLFSFHEPFVLISTGTWCISLNPFNHSPLTQEELKNDCLCYLQYNGKPVKASRLFLGYTHNEQVNRIADHFHADSEKYKHILFDEEIATRLTKSIDPASLRKCSFEERQLSAFTSDQEAYHQLILDLITQQAASTNLLARSGNVKKVFVDGGFSKNEIYMRLLARAFPQTRVYAASIPQASALGAALVIHDSWNNQPIGANIIELRSYSAAVSS